LIKQNNNIKAQGKGFFGKWKAQVSDPYIYVEWYQSITPEQAMKETPGNFAIDNSSIISISTKMYGGDEIQISEYYTDIQTTGQNFRVIAAYDTKSLLKHAFSKQVFK
jgi:hypothetical protein